jgi:hypothetical protein
MSTSIGKVVFCQKGHLPSKWLSSVGMVVFRQKGLLLPEKAYSVIIHHHPSSFIIHNSSSIIHHPLICPQNPEITKHSIMERKKGANIRKA